MKVAGRLLPVFVIHSFFLLVNSFGLALFIAVCLVHHRPTIQFVPTSDVATHKILMESVGQVQLYSIIMPLFITWRTYCRKVGFYLIKEINRFRTKWPSSVPTQRNSCTLPVWPSSGKFAPRSVPSIVDGRVPLYQNIVFC